MVGQSNLMPGQLPGYARAAARVCPGLATPLINGHLYSAGSLVLICLRIDGHVRIYHL